MPSLDWIQINMDFIGYKTGTISIGLLGLLDFIGYPIVKISPDIIIATDGE